MKKRIILFGPSGKLGRCITTEALKEGCDVIGIGRTANPECTSFYAVDFENDIELNKTLLKACKEQPSAIIFAQRSRSKHSGFNHTFYKC